MNERFNRIRYKIISKAEQITICAGQTNTDWICAEYQKKGLNDESKLTYLPSGCQ